MSLRFSESWGSDGSAGGSTGSPLFARAPAGEVGCWRWPVGLNVIGVISSLCDSNKCTKP